MQGVRTARLAVASLRDRPRPWLIGVLHLPALPGAPGAGLPVDVAARQAVEDAQVLEECGFTAIMLENFHDTPFLPDAVAPETIASLAVVAWEVRRATSVPIGVNVLRNDALAALGIAVACSLSFVRVNVLAGAAATDQGVIEGRADTLLRRRAALGADVAILADVDVKHATALDTRPLTTRARDLVARSGADAVLVTGDSTGQPVDLETLGAVAQTVGPTPTLAASGTTPESLPDVLSCCDGAIVGTALKNPETGRVDPDRAAALAKRRPS